MINYFEIPVVIDDLDNDINRWENEGGPYHSEDIPEPEDL